MALILDSDREQLVTFATNKLHNNILDVVINPKSQTVSELKKIIHLTKWRMQAPTIDG